MFVPWSWNRRRTKRVEVKQGSFPYDVFNMEWPNHYPDGCPPEDAVDTSGEVFRLVDRNPPTPADFKTQYDINSTRDWGRNLCKACGISVFRDSEEVRAAARKIPSLRGKQVATATLEPSMGKIKHTPARRKRNSTHHTWWLPVSMEPWIAFSVLEET